MCKLLFNARYSKRRTLIHIFSHLRLFARVVEEHSQLTVKEPSTHYKPSGPEWT